MELGGLTQFRYVPEWRDNRKAPEGERLSLTVMRLRAIDVLNDDDDEDVRRWRDEQEVTEEAREVLDAAPISTLRLLRVCSRNTKDLQGFRFGGKEVAAPLEAYLRLRFDANALLVEILQTINRTATMSEDELGNFVSLSDGSATPATESAPGAAEGEPPASADTKEEANEP